MAETWDILNAGPRHRFTAAGVVVGNCLQDHGGNYHRHGSLNADREWSLALTNSIAVGMRQERLRAKKDAEPIVCPSCGKVRMGGLCSCGHRCERKSRVVVQHDGTLKEKEGDIYKPRRIKVTPDTEKLWMNAYYRAKNSRNGMTFNQAYGMFFMDHHYYPPKDMPFMPKSDLDWFRKVRDVRVVDLTSKNRGDAA